jgi:5-methylcytosine-specific restriction endonuclease McrA
MIHRTLLLTAWYLPQKVVRWQDAITMVCLDKVDVIAEYDATVSSPSVTVRIPAVIRSRKANPRLRPVVRFSRASVMLRDNFTCQYCGSPFHEKDLTLDHVVPRSAGGRTEWNNIVVACRACNYRKGCLTCDEAGMWPITEPKKPVCLPIRKQAVSQSQVSIPEQWEPFLV